MKMATQENAERGTSIKERTPIEVLTENGYTIVRKSDLEPTLADSARDCRFLVRDSDNHEREVKVEFNENTIALVNELRPTPLRSESTFWICCAEQHLATYLWQMDEEPPDGSLVIDSLSPEDLRLACTWSG
ncbi:MAG TPA: hypothetical protein VHE60_17820 [Pyrinomonadaceae bacterium]|nr:hypothetical protein [Pyrinomonadaceae bacterium]